MDDSVEVFWDHDSPTPSAWRLLQGPSRIEEDLHCSPQLPRTKKFTTRPRVSTDNYPKFEESRKEVDQIINALRRASKDCDGKQSIVEKRLMIPDLPEEEESEDDMQPNTVPFQAKPLSNTSMDLIFDMSGGGEELACTVASTNRAMLPLKKVPLSPNTDAWTDDDLFADDSLMLEVDNAVIPTKSMKMTPARNSTARKTSTPANVTKICTRNTERKENIGSTNSAKGFLDFFMDDDRPAKPSPKKDKTKILPQKSNYKFVSKSKSSNTTNTFSTNNVPTTSKTNVNCEVVLSGTKSHIGINNKVLTSRNGTSLKCDTKFPTSGTVKHIASKAPAKSKIHDSSIPPEVLEELIMEDSWTETEDENQEVPLSINKNVTSAVNHKTAPVKQNVQLTRSAAYKFTNKKLTNNTNRQMHGHLPKANNQPVSKPKQVKELANVDKQEASTDGFSSEDDDMLMEAVALTESQQSSSSKGSTQRSAKSASNSTSSSSSQPKCSAMEIERKKRLAMERRMQRMKQHQSNR